MSKQTELAALFIGAGMGMDDARMDITCELELPETIAYYTEAMYYAPIAVAMVEAAHGVTFSWPTDWQWEIYAYFGERINDNSEYIEANEGLDDDDDAYDEDATNSVKPPDRGQMLDILEGLVCQSFNNVATMEMFPKIKQAVAQARQEAA